MIDLLQDQPALQDTEATSTIGFRDQCRQVPRLGELLDEGLGILPFFIQLPPVRPRIELAEVVHRLPECLLFFRQCDPHLCHGSLSPSPLLPSPLHPTLAALKPWRP